MVHLSYTQQLVIINGSDSAASWNATHLLWSIGELIVLEPHLHSSISGEVGLATIPKLPKIIELPSKELNASANKSCVHRQAPQAVSAGKASIFTVAFEFYITVSLCVCSSRGLTLRGVR